MLRLLMLFMVLSFAACAGSKPAERDSEKTNEAMITFVTKARADYWREAMEIVTPDERNDMMEGGKVLPEYREAVSRIRLSTIRNMEGLGLDRKGRLMGLKELLDESNERVRVAEEGEVEKIDTSKLEDLEAKRAKDAEKNAAQIRETIEKENAQREKEARDLLDGIDLDDLLKDSN